MLFIPLKFECTILYKHKRLMLMREKEIKQSIDENLFKVVTFEYIFFFLKYLNNTNLILIICYYISWISKNALTYHSFHFLCLGLQTKQNHQLTEPMNVFFNIDCSRISNFKYKFVSINLNGISFKMYLSKFFEWKREQAH